MLNAITLIFFGLSIEYFCYDFLSYNSVFLSLNMINIHPQIKHTYLYQDIMFKISFIWEMPVYTDQEFVLLLEMFKDSVTRHMLCVFSI